MSCTGETVLVSIETKPSFLVLNRHSLFTEAVFSSPLVQSTMDNLTKIFCVARSLSSFRLALEATTYFKGQLCNGTIKMLLENCGMQFQNTKQKEDIQLQITADQLFDYGRKLVTELIQQNAPESLQESKLLDVVISALGLPHCEKCSKTECASSISWNVKDGIANALWHVAEERWKETSAKLSEYKPEKIIHDAIELVQDRIKDAMANNSLVSQILEASDYLTATTQSMRSEAEILSQLLGERRDHTLANVTEFWNGCCENHTTLETLYSLINDCIVSRVNCEGLELLSEYIWTTKPVFYDLDLLEMNYPQIDDDGFHFMQEERIPRRSILFIGTR